MKRIIVLIIAIFIMNIANAQWAQTNGPWGSNILCLAISGDTLVAGTNNGSIFLSINNGLSWTNISNGIPANIAFTAIAISDTTLIVGSWGNGLYKKSFNDTSWTAMTQYILTTYNKQYITSISVKGQTFFVGTYGGNVKSTDEGITWTSIVGIDSYVMSLAFNDNNIFVGTLTKGVYLSTDNGNNWYAANTGILANSRVNALAIHGTSIFAGTPNGILLSTNNGFSWTSVNYGLPDTTVNALLVNGNNIYEASSSGVYLSTNNGSNWAAVNTGLNANVNYLIANGTNIFAGTNGGVFLSTNNGSNWKSSSNGMNVTANSFAANGPYIYSGTKSNGVFYTTNEGDTWTAIDKGLTNTLINNINLSGNNLFAGTYGGVFMSTNSGVNWTQKGFVDTTITALASKDNNIFVGTFGKGLYLSTNTGDSWNAINNGLVPATHPSASIFLINDSNIFARTEFLGIWKSHNNGNNWINANNGLPNISCGVFSLAKNGNNVFAGTLGMYSSINNGSNWSLLGLDTFLVYSIAIIGDNIFAGTDYGVYISTNNGNSWHEVNDGLPTGYISAKSLFINGIYIYAGINNEDIGIGCGVWKRSLSEMVGIEKNTFNYKVFIYPNPTKDNLTIETNLNTEQRLEIINLIGQTVYTNIIYKKATINTSAFANGVYILKLSSDKETVVKKFVKE